MTIQLITFAALTIASTIATIMVVARDGYGRIPTRRF